MILLKLWDFKKKKKLPKLKSLQLQWLFLIDESTGVSTPEGKCSSVSRRAWDTWTVGPRVHRVHLNELNRTRPHLNNDELDPGVFPLRSVSPRRVTVHAVRSPRRFRSLPSVRNSVPLSLPNQTGFLKEFQRSFRRIYISPLS